MNPTGNPPIAYTPLLLTLSADVEYRIREDPPHEEVSSCLTEHRHLEYRADWENIWRGSCGGGAKALHRGIAASRQYKLALKEDCVELAFR